MAISLLLLAALAQVGGKRSCVLPPYPPHGRYSVAGAPDVGPGVAFDSAFFTVTCDPGYYVTGTNHVFCSQYHWVNEMPQCQPCGVVPSDELKTVATNTPEYAPWHAGVYLKTGGHYICGGSIVTNAVIISVAHCFWDHGEPTPRAATEFVVAVGKTHRDWTASDPNAQKSDVAEIKLSPRYLGHRGNFQDDIALVKMTSFFEFSRLVMPVCLNFDYSFDERQLRDGNIGKIAAWQDRRPDTPLKLLDVKAINIEKCIEDAPTHFKAYITSDKTCGVLQIGDIEGLGISGSGAVYPEENHGNRQHYLRGVVANSPRERTTNLTTLVAFTHLIQHQNLIKNNLQ